MKIKEVDLYEFFKIERKGASGGYVTVYARDESKEIKKRLRPAVLIFPGGGYGSLSDREAEPVALKFLANGFVAFVLSYSVKTKYPVPLIEAMLAMTYIRSQVNKYSINAEHICCIGFSAGGHLAGLLGSLTREEAELIDKDVNKVKPNALILSYPVVTMGEHTHFDSRAVITGGDESLYAKLSVDKRITADSAPALIWHTYEDDCVPVENSLSLVAAYRENKVPFALHIFEYGGHGLSTADDETCDFTIEQQHLYGVGKWFDLAIDWLKVRGFKIETQR